MGFQKMSYLGVTKQGLLSGFRTMVQLTKIIFPITVLLTILQHTPLLTMLASYLAPFMHVLGLSGEAAFVLVLGNVLNLYAAIGAMLTMSFTVKQVFILAIMLGFSHNLLVETTVARYLGMSPWLSALLRLSLAVGAAFIIHHVWIGPSPLAPYVLQGETMNAAAAADIGGDSAFRYIHDGQSLLAAFIEGVTVGASGLWKIAMIVMPLMFAIEWAKAMGVVDVLSRGLSPVLRLLGVREELSIIFLAGLFFGLAFGAGMIMESARERSYPRRDLVLLGVFLSASHAVVEDTLIFVPLGIPVIWLFLLRTMTAVLLTVILARLWRAPVTHHASQMAMDQSS
ncbi:MAG: Nucleoside binding-domain containing protein [Candidatus Carbobacillus altaicus]|uniref:Nucleoside binding-domain containing protein n=1 Tax=Candidatus Carbonibacillus altaicus TaxID=2163959 RepID=A0A2R6XZY3_9BACL|nr:MAG: Nucleoside binding-domain containing protein [Candidatus Carbobacillus altaicus]